MISVNQTVRTACSLSKKMSCETELHKVVIDDEEPSCKSTKFLLTGQTKLASLNVNCLTRF